MCEQILIKTHLLDYPAVQTHPKRLRKRQRKRQLRGLLQLFSASSHVRWVLTSEMRRSNIIHLRTWSTRYIIYVDYTLHVPNCHSSVRNTQETHVDRICINTYVHGCVWYLMKCSQMNGLPQKCHEYAHLCTMMYLCKPAIHLDFRLFAISSMDLLIEVQVLIY